MTHAQGLTRTSFLRIATRALLWLAGILGLGGLARFFSHEPESGPPSSYDLGAKQDFPPDSKTIFLDIPAVVYVEGGEYLAFSLKCTHLGCTLADQGEGFSCPCHGSEFSSYGRARKGPALEDLPELQVEISEDDRLILRMGGESP